MKIKLRFEELNKCSLTLNFFHSLGPVVSIFRQITVELLFKMVESSRSLPNLCGHLFCAFNGRRLDPAKLSFLVIVSRKSSCL